MRFAKDTGSSDVEVPVFGGIDQRDLDVLDGGKDVLCNPNPAERSADDDDMVFARHD